MQKVPDHSDFDKNIREVYGHLFDSNNDKKVRDFIEWLLDGDAAEVSLCSPDMHGVSEKFLLLLRDFGECVFFSTDELVTIYLESKIELSNILLDLWEPLASITIVDKSFKKMMFIDHDGYNYSRFILT